MKAFLLTQWELDELREKLRADWLEHCAKFDLRPHLVNDPNHHDYDLFAKFNFTYCRWMSAVSDERFGVKDLRPDPAPNPQPSTPERK